MTTKAARPRAVKNAGLRLASGAALVRNMFGEIVTEWWGADNARHCATSMLSAQGHGVLWEDFTAECFKCGRNAYAKSRESEAHGAGFELVGDALTEKCDHK